MAINPELITTIRVDQLPDETLSLTNLFPHTVGTDLKSATIQELVDLVATAIGVSGGVGYIAISVTDGQQLPDVPELPSFFLCGAGTFLNINGYPNIICTENLNAIMSLTDHWELAVEIPINPLSGTVESVTGSAVDNTDPLNPVINSTGSAGTLAETLILGNITDGTDISISDGDKILLDNGANLKKGTTDAGLGGSKGIALRCAVDYELKWEAGRLYVMGGDGFTIREVSHNFTNTPTVTDDDDKGFVIDSRWILDNGNVYVCTDATTGAAVWELQDLGTIPTLQDVVETGNKYTGLNGFTEFDSQGNLNLSRTDEEYIVNLGTYIGLEISTSDSDAGVIGIGINQDGSDFVGLTRDSGLGNRAYYSLGNRPDGYYDLATTDDIPTLQEVTNEGAETNIPLIVKQTENERTITLQSNGLGFEDIVNEGTTLLVFEASSIPNQQVLIKNESGTLALLSDITGAGVTSVGLTMPSAFSVTNSPITSSGDIAVIGAGLVSQYVRGDGTLANFPNSTGGGSSVNYYLNGSVSQGTFGGDTYYQLSKTPIIGAGTNFTRTNGAGNGYIASFITDAGDPSFLNIPGGNWNLEFYFQSSASGGSPQFYGEIYKVSATNVFTLVASGSANPEGITNGTTVDQYFTSISVPQTSLLITDRLAIRIYVITSGRTITLHTENGNLCEVLTTFTTGLTALNGLTTQVQNLSVGTSGTDFAISSSTDTHTFNLPTASASNRGALSTTDWSTFNGKQNALSYTPYRNVQTSQTALTGTVAETIVFTATIPANSFNSVDVIKILYGANKTTGLGAYTLRIRLNTTNTISGAPTIALYSGTATAQVSIMMRNFNLNGGNLYGLGGGNSGLTDIIAVGSALGSNALNPANIFYLFATIQLANASDSIIGNMFTIHN